MTGRGARKYTFLLTAGFAILGSVFLLWSLLDRDDSWVSNVTINLGVALLLFAPLFPIGRRFEKRLDLTGHAQVELEARQLTAESNIATVAEQLDESISQMRIHRDPLEEAALRRIAASDRQDQEVFAAVGERPSHAALAEALYRATQLNIIHWVGCRVIMREPDLCIHFSIPEFTQARGYVEPRRRRLSTIRNAVRLEVLHTEPWIDEVIAKFDWTTTISAEDLLVSIYEVVKRFDRVTGLDKVNPAHIFTTLQRLLEFAYATLMTGGDRAQYHLPVVELPSAGWVVKLPALVSMDGRDYWHFDRLMGPDPKGKIPRKVRRLLRAEGKSFKMVFDHAINVREYIRTLTEWREKPIGQRSYC